MRYFLPWLSLFAFLGLAVSSASAQSRDSVLSRIDAVEAKLESLQGSSATPTIVTNNGQAQIALGAIQEDLRRLRGDIEQLNHSQRRQQEQLEQLSKEMDLRFDKLRQAQPVAAPFAPVPSQEPVTTPVIEAPAVAPPTPKAQSETPGEDYKTAFETLNKGDYVTAEQQFGTFINRYPKHSLIGNAHYWLGETYYVQEQFDAAADEFRQGFQTMPQGPKAPDNLLRLGMTLGTLDRKKEACIILKQLMTKYAGQSKAVERKATHEREKFGCK